MLKPSAMRAYAKEVASVGILLTVALAALLRDTPPDRDAPIIVPPAIHADVTVDSTSVVQDHTTPAVGVLPEKPEAAPWHGWVWLDGPRLEAASDVPSLRLVAARIPDGVAVLLYNPSEAPIAIQLATRMPPGRYTIDRLMFSGASRQTERLQSCALEKTGDVRKPGVLPANSGVVYRYVDHVARAAGTYRRAMQQINRLRSTSPTPYRRLAGALRECPGLLSRAQTAVRASDPEPGLRALHRALLNVGHATALCRNATGTRQVNKEHGALIEQRLSDLETSLVESSIASLNLVPSASARVSPNESDAGVSVVVAVRNAGTRTVNGLRVWATGDKGLSVEPGEAAVFASLRPRESVTAEFRVKANPSDGRALATDDILGCLYGHVAYVRASSPAHLRFAAALPPLNATQQARRPAGYSASVPHVAQASTPAQDDDAATRGAGG